MAGSEVHVEAAGREIRISSADKVMFPDQGWTKLDVVEHFLMCAEGALRGVRNRPSLLKRWNRGVAHQPLFVKRPKTDRNLVDVRFPSARPGRMFAPQDEGDVIWMAQMNCIDLNPWNARADDLEHPDEMRIDLDPTEDYDFEAARDVAAAARELLDEIGLVGWPKTSGNRGIHIYVRVRRDWDFYEVRRAGLAIARELEAALRARPAAAADYFEAAATSYKRNVLRWIKLARTPGTRAKRIDRVADLSEQQRRVPQM